MWTWVEFIANHALRFMGLDAARQFIIYDLEMIVVLVAVVARGGGGMTGRQCNALY